MLARDHYAALGLSSRATPEEIEEAYRHLSRRYHPDVNPGDPRSATVYARIQAAYEVLSDPESRERYDRGVAEEHTNAGAPELTVRLRSESAPDRPWGELVSELARHARRTGAARGEDLTVTVEIPLFLAERGRRTPIRVRRRVRCESCAGRGRTRVQDARTCERCDGSGKEIFQKGRLAISATCSDCRGAGNLPGRACDACGGSGLVVREGRAAVRIPGGVPDGHELRLMGEGHRGRRGGPPGDLVARVRVLPEPGFERSGPHLLTPVEIDYTTAILGGRVPVRSIDGDEISLKIPPLTPNGREFRLRGRGLEMSDGRRGDMLVRVEIRIPDSIDEDGKRLVRQLAERTSAPRTIHPAREGDHERRD